MEAEVEGEASLVTRDPTAVAARSAAPVGHINFWQQDELRMGNHEKKVRSMWIALHYAATPAETVRRAAKCAGPHMSACIAGGAEGRAAAAGRRGDADQRRPLRRAIPDGSRAAWGGGTAVVREAFAAQRGREVCAGLLLAIRTGVVRGLHSVFGRCTVVRYRVSKVGCPPRRRDMDNTQLQPGMVISLLAAGGQRAGAAVQAADGRPAKESKQKDKHRQKHRDKEKKSSRRPKTASLATSDLDRLRAERRQREATERSRQLQMLRQTHRT